MEEIWKDILGYEGIYQVSTFGNVRSLDRVITSNIKGKPYTKTIKGLQLSPVDNGLGYLQVNLGTKVKKYVHWLVAQAFVENTCVDCNYEVNHKDHDKKNNNFLNLEWVSKKDNHIKRVIFYGKCTPICIDCFSKLSCNKAKRCVNCSRLNSRRVKNRPTKEYLNELLKIKSYTEVGKLFNVSGNTIKNWLK